MNYAIILISVYLWLIVIIVFPTVFLKTRLVEIGFVIYKRKEGKTVYSNKTT